MSRTRRFLGGVGFGYANQILITVTGLWLTPFLLRSIGQHDYGLWLVGTQVLAYLALMDFGVVALLPRETAFATGRTAATGSADELPELVGQTASLALWQTPLVAVVAAALWFAMPDAWEMLRAPLGLVLAVYVVAFPLRIFQAVLQGLQDLAFLAKMQMATWLASLAVVVGLVFAGFGLYSLAAGWVVTTALGVPVLWWRLRKRFPGALPRRLPQLPWTKARGRLAQGFWMSTNQVAMVLLFGTDVLIISKFFGPAAVVPYACTAKLVMVLANQPQMLMQVALPALSEMRTGAQREQLSKVCIALSQAMLVVSGAVVCVVLATNRGFVNWWVGAEQFGGFGLTTLLLLSMLLRHFNLTVGYMLFSFAYDRRLAITSLLDGLVTVVALVVFTRAFGATGAPLAMIAGVCLVSLPANLSALSRAGIMPVRMLLRSLAPWFWRFALVAVVSALVARNFVPDTFPALALAASLVALVYVALMLGVVLRDPLGEYVRPRLAPLGARFFRSLRTGNVA